MTSRPAVPRAPRRAATHCVAALALFVVSLVVLASGRPAAAADGKVNVNAASAAQLAKVPGIGDDLAVRIVAQRAAHGPFHKLDDLLAVPGFSKLLMVQAADHLEVGPPPASAPARAPIGSARANGHKLDLNRATFSDLLLLRDMTPRGAKAIVDYRERNHGFHSVEELDRVPGLDKRLIVGLLNEVDVPRAAPAGGGASDDTVTLGDSGWSGSWVSKLETNATPTPAATPKPALGAGEKVDINVAGRDDLERLPDIGPVMSQRIVEYRSKNGPFRSVEGLLQVRGIGQQRLAAMRPYVVVEGARAERAEAPPHAVARATPRHEARESHEARETPHASVARAEHTERVAPAAAARAVLPDGRVNINLAGIDDLLTLPRMTRDAAAEIISFRQRNGPFHDPHAITNVPTIGEAAYARLRDKITVGE